jgi:lipoate-protein ligase A
MGDTTETWRLLLDGGASGFRNMAVDEALLDGVRAGERRHSLRLYWFSPPCLSLGANQPLEEVDRAACERYGVEVVRRPTGGRAVLHDGDLTYAVCGPDDGAVFSGGIRSSYSRVSEALLDAVRRLGLFVASVAQPAVSSAAPQPASPSCFDSVAPYEILVAGLKLAGSAQVRRGGAVLQHGSLRMLAPSVSAGRLLRKRRTLEPLPESPEPPVLGELVGGAVDRTAAMQAVAAGFASRFDVCFERLPLSGADDELADQIEHSKFRTDEWTCRR